MQSENIKDLVTALVAAQQTIKQPKKDGVNPGFKAANGKGSRFASLGECFDSVRDSLNAHGLVVTQMVQGPALQTMLMHTSGQWLASEYPLAPAQQTPQAVGSAISYARRYSLCAMLGLVAEEDDDANAASEKESKAAADARAAFVAKTKPKEAV